MFKFTVETVSKKLTELLTETQLAALERAKWEVWYKFILQVVWAQNIHIYIWDEDATLDSYILYAWNEKEDNYITLDSINLIADGANNTDVRIITS